MTHLRWTSFTVLGALMGCTTLAPEPVQQAHVSDPQRSQWRPQQSPISQRPEQARAPATAFAVPEPAAKEQGVPGWQGPTIVALAPNVYELRPSPRSALSQRAAEWPALAASAPWSGLPEVRLEVSNGVGTSRLARRTAQRLSETGWRPARLTNAPSYRQPITRIEYLPGQLPAVQALAEHLPMPMQQVQVDRLQAHMHIRLVLGHDQAGRSIASWAREAPLKNASAGHAAALPR
jgi:hypothetical protein